ncbi:hypothetical protein ACFQ6N_06325 [Kitasatospora sp. NPDC056446]|uniref:hypothetical protein n=1 Tax=Kitasatospora sp. NPDC056446 TaxID=3345819 RepID=UPI003693241F
MAVIAVVGGPGAPGATTTALALLLAWPLQPGRRVLLVEADPDGGAVLAGALEGRVEAVYGLRNLAVADRRGLLVQTIWEQLIDLSPDGDGHRLLLPGLTDPTQAPGLAYTWEPLAELLHGIEQQGYDVIVDLGRSGATGASGVLARRADVVAMTVRTTLRGLSSIRPRLSALTEDLTSGGTGADALGLLLVDEGPYARAEVSRELGLPVLGTLPYATRTAKVLSDGGDTTDRRFIRSELMRTARSAADEVQALVRRRRQRLAPGSEAGAAGQAPALTAPAVPVPVPAPAPVGGAVTGASVTGTSVPGMSVAGPATAVGPVAVGPVAAAVPNPPTPTPAPTGYETTAYEPAAYETTAYEPAGYEPTGYGQASYAQPSYGRQEPSYAQPAPAPTPYGSAVYGQRSAYPQPSYGPVEAEPPSYAPPSYSPPSYAPPQPVPPVIVTGPVAPLAGLAPQPAAPAPFPAHVQQPRPAAQSGQSGQAGQAGQSGQANPGGPGGQNPLQQTTVTDDQVPMDGPYPYNPGEVLRAR